MLGLDAVDAPHPGDHLGAVGARQQLLGHGTGRHPADRFPRRGAPAAAAGLDPVLGLVGGIGMGGPEGHLHLLVIAGPLVPVAHHHGDRCAKGHPIEQAAEDLDAVVFLAGRGDAALAGTPPVELGLDRLQIERQTGRAAVDDHPHATTVGFAEGADAEKLPEAAAHHDAGPWGPRRLEPTRPHEREPEPAARRPGWRCW